MTRNRKPVFNFRRNHPKDFEEVCETCIPQRRFKLPPHKKQHDIDKHKISSPSLRTIKADELNSFVCDEIEPDTAYNKRFKAVVDRLCHFMQKELKPSDIIKSGSLGKGTAVKGKSDADLVVFLNSIDTISKLKKNMTKIIDDMKLRLNKCDDCHVEGSTQFAVQVSVNCDKHSHSVDILPSTNIIGNCEKQKCEAIYKEMANASKRERKYYSAALAPLQVKFVSRVPPKVKNLIRVIKYWRKTEFKERADKHKLPSSYPLELIAIKEWENSGAHENFDLCKVFYNLLKTLADYKSLKQIWTENYKFNNFDSKPNYLVDPANPYNNVMDASDLWDHVAKKARKYLKVPLFQELYSSNDSL